METIKIDHPLSDTQRHKLNILELVYDSLSKNEHLNDAFILYKDMREPLKDLIESQKEKIIDKAMNLSPEDKNNNRTYLAQFLCEGKSKIDLLDNNCKAVFVNWFFKPLVDVMDKQTFINSTKHYFIFKTQKP